MSKEITDGKPIPLSHIKHKKLSDIDIKISRNIHRFRSTKTAEKNFDMIIQNALKDAFITGQEVGYERPHAWAYIQGIYNSRIKNTLAELIRLEIRDMLKNVK